MSDLTNRLSKAVFDYLETAKLRSEPFSLSRIEEVIAGVMATEGKKPYPRWEVQETTAPTLIDKDHADFLDSSAGTWGMGVSTTSPVTYDLSADPDAFKKARVGDMVICEIGKDLVGYGDHQKWSCLRIMNSECNRWIRIA